MSLNYHRCHGQECEAGRNPKSFTSQGEEFKKGFKRCHCPIVANGSFQGVSQRKATKQTDWGSAAAVMAPYVAANSWVLPDAPVLVPVPAPEGAVTGLMTDAVRAYLAAHEKEGTAESTITGHRIRLNTAIAFCARKGIVKVDQWTEKLAQEFIAATPVAAITQTNYQNNLKAFLNWCKVEGWSKLEQNPAKYKASIRNRKSKAATRPRQVFPFSDVELDWMYAACRHYDGLVLHQEGRSGKGILVPGKFYRVWTGEDLMDFIDISVYTGLRISNVARFHIGLLKGRNQIQVRTIKGDTPVLTAVPEWLADRIRLRAEQVGPYIFGTHTSVKNSVITSQWRNRLKTLWAQHGPWETKPHPHRFRHTFARILLQKGFSFSEVAQLMGNTEKVVRDHYSAWVPELQQQLSAKLEQAFINVPSPHSPRKANVQPIKVG